AGAFPRTTDRAGYAPARPPAAICPPDVAATRREHLDRAAGLHPAGKPRLDRGASTIRILRAPAAADEYARAPHGQAHGEAELRRREGPYRRGAFARGRSHLRAVR